MTSREAGLASLLAAYFVVYLHRVSGSSLYPELASVADRYGLDPEAFSGLVASLYFYGYAAMQLPGGVLADVLGVRRFVASFLSIMALGSALMSVESPLPMAVGRFLVGLGAASVFISIMRYSSLFFGPASQGTVAASAAVVGNLGGIAAGYPLRAMVDAIGYQATLLALSLMAALPALLALRIEERGVAAGRSLREGMAEVVLQLRAAVVRSRVSWASGVSMAAYYGSFLAFHGFWSLGYLMASAGVDESVASTAVSLAAVGYAAASVVAGRLSDVLRARKAVLLAGSALYAACWTTALTSPPSSPAAALAWAAAVGAAAGPALVTAVTARDPYPARYAGTAFSFANLMGFAGVALYQNASAYAASALGYGALLKLYLLNSLLLVAFVAVAMPETYPGDRRFNRGVKRAEPREPRC